MARRRPAWALAAWLLPLSAAAGSPPLTFLAIGDWGGANDLHPVTHAQVLTAYRMGQVAAELNASFVLGLGDNFYPAGISRWNQGRLKSTFEDVYAAPSLQVDWWFVAGNHDHLGDINYQLAFSQQSRRWKYPAPYYNLIKELPSGKTVEFVMCDAVTLVDTANKTQWDWLENRLAASTADYLFTVAHYPIWSACSHGPTAALAPLRRMLRQYRVTAHLAGHDHCLMHIMDHGVHHVLSGAGRASYWYHLRNVRKLQDAELVWHMAADNAGDHQGGFASITLEDHGATTWYYSHDGSLLFKSEPAAPRSWQSSKFV